MPNLPDRARAVLDYWTDLGPEGWYAGGAELDAEIRQRFEGDWTLAAQGGLRGWQSCPEGLLAYLLVTDQFPRNMFRDSARAFATDRLARDAAMRGWMHKMDLALPEPIRQFFYLPFMHAETTVDQDRCVALIKARMPQTGAGNLLHARVHREVIRRFGRFPYRNAALGRATTAEEQAFLDEGGYGSLVRALGG